MVRFRTAPRIVFALLGLCSAAIAAFYTWVLYANPEDRGWGTYEAVAVLAVGALLFLRIAIAGNPGRFLGRRMTLTGVANDGPVSSEDPAHR